MPAKKKTARARKATRGKAARVRKTARKSPARARSRTRRAVATTRRTGRTAARRVETAWKQALRSLESGEKQAEKEIRAFIKKSGLDTRQASALWKRWNARLERESRRVGRQLEVGLADLQTRARKESRAFGHMVEDAVQSALAALNIPSRHEVQQLTRKVNQLSRKIDGFRR